MLSASHVAQLIPETKEAFRIFLSSIKSGRVRRSECTAFLRSQLATEESSVLVIADATCSSRTETPPHIRALPKEPSLESMSRLRVMYGHEDSVSKAPPPTDLWQAFWKPLARCLNGRTL